MIHDPADPMIRAKHSGAVLRWGRGAQAPPNVGQAPPNILVPTAKIRILKI